MTTEVGFHLALKFKKLMHTTEVICLLFEYHKNVISKNMSILRRQPVCCVGIIVIFVCLLLLF
jgi:hypothetical protein